MKLNKATKRFVCYVLSASLSIANLPMTYAQETKEEETNAVTSEMPINLVGFDDVKATDWYYDSVIKSVENGIFTGITQDEFDPMGSMTRAMYVTILGRMAEINTANYQGESHFTDVEQNSWYTPYVNWASELGITNGVSETEFAPNVLVTREQMATLITNFFDVYKITYPNEVRDTLPVDYDKTADYAKEAVKKLFQTGILNGDNNQNFNPKNNASRAEGATLATRIFDVVELWLEAGNTFDVSATLDNKELFDEYDPRRNNTKSVTFYDGDTLEVIDTASVSAGNPVHGNVPDTDKANAFFVGWFTDEAMTEPFYTHDPVTESISVYAKYDQMERIATDPNLTVYSEINKDPDFALTVVRKEGTVTGSDIATLKVMDGTKGATLQITSIGNDEYSISAEEGFTPGSTYEIHLADGFVFKTDEGEKPASIRKASLTISAIEETKLKLNEDLVYIAESATTSLVVDDESTNWDEYSNPIVSADINETPEEQTFSTGSFSITTVPAGLEIGDMISVYAGETRPDEVRNELGERASFLIVTNINGNTIEFREPETAEELMMAYFMPDNIPFSVTSADLIPENSFKVEIAPDEDSETYPVDDVTRILLELDEFDSMDDFKIGDFVTFYVGNINEIELNGNDVHTKYGEITAINGNEITFVTVDVEYIENIFNTYMTDTPTYEELMDGVSEADLQMMKDSIIAQVYDSGFADLAAEELTKYVMNTDEFKDMAGLENITLSDENGNLLSPEDIALMAGYAPAPVIGIPIITVSFGESEEHFSDGITATVRIEMEITIEPGKKDLTRKTLMIDIGAEFQQDVKFDVKMGASADVDWKVIIPVISSIRFDAAIDVYSYTNIEFDASIYSLKANEGLAGKKIQQLFGLNKKTKSKIEMVLGLKEQIELLRELGEHTYEQIAELEAEALDLWEGVKDEAEESGLGYVFEDLSADDLYEAEFDFTDVTEDLDSLLKEDDQDSLDAGIQEMMERYSEMMTVESQWMEMVRHIIIDQEYCYYGVAVGFTVFLVIKAKVNIAIGSEIEYLVGKRYAFYFDIVKGTSGSSVTDLLDEKFSFKFYVMGNLGIRAGVELQIRGGIINTKFASIGGSAELGVYVELWGYFIYNYSKYSPANSDVVYDEEDVMGAILLDFGLYMELTFRLAVLNGAFAFEPVLYDGFWPLYTYGDEINVYDFVYDIDPESETRLAVVDDVDDEFGNITMKLPEVMRTMKTINLRDGQLANINYGTDRFNFYMSNSNFVYDPASNVITVNPPEGVRYMESELRIVWKGSKSAFSKYDIDLTIPLVWTNLDDAELKQPVTYNVIIEDEAGTRTMVHSDMVYKGEAFAIPTEAEILDMINYSAYDVLLENGSYENLKYESVDGYDENIVKDTTTMLTEVDANYIFKVDIREFTLEVVDDEDNNILSDTARFGENFDISPIVGKEIEEIENGNTKYMIIDGVRADMSGDADNSLNVDGDYDGATKADDGRDVTGIIDMNFAKELLRGETVYKATYSDNSANITYTFKGINADSIDVNVKKGTMPTSEHYNDILADAGYSNAILTDISPSFTPAETDAVYTLTFTLTSDEIEKSTLTYDSNDGSEISAITLPVGYIISEPTAPTKTGFDFVGWYSDEALETPFVHSKMPEVDTTVYAKWEAIPYTLTYSTTIGSISNNTKTVYYNKAYGDLPTSEDIEEIPFDKAFEGWYTEDVGGEIVTAETIHDLADDVTIYARWRTKETISITHDLEDNNNYTYVYKGTPPEFVFTATSGDKTITDGFTIRYMRVGTGGNIWKDSPEEGGTYNVQVSRAGDDTYSEYSKTFNNAYVINKANSPNITTKPQVIARNGIVVVVPDRVNQEELVGATYEYRVNDGAWSTKPIFYVDGNTATVQMRVSQYDRNYNQSNVITANTVNVSQNSGDGFETRFFVETLHDGKSDWDFELRLLLKEGGHYTHAFYPTENGQVDDRTVNLEPWEVGGLQIVRTDGGNLDHWGMEEYGVQSYYKGRSNKEIVSDGENAIVVWIDEDTPPFTRTFNQAKFKREIHTLSGTRLYNGRDDDAFQLGSNDIEITFSGMTNDQYYNSGSGYNAYDYAHAPVAYYALEDVSYSQYFTQKVDGFTIDSDKLKEELISEGIKSMQVLYVVEYLETSAIDNANRVQTAVLTLESGLEEGAEIRITDGTISRYDSVR